MITDINWQEATSGTINLVGDDLDTVVRMLSYLYTSEYDDVKSHILGLENPIPLLSNPNNSSSKTTRPTSGDEDGPPQKIARIEKYTSPIDDDVRSALFNNVLVYAIADKYDIVGLQAVAIEYFKSRAKELKRWPPPYLREIVKMVYETTPESDRGLRRALVKICYTYHTPSTLNLEDAYKATATEFNAFCWDLLRYVHSYYTGSRMRQSGFIL